MENERERLGEWKSRHEPVDFVHIGPVGKNKERKAQKLYTK